MAHLWVSGEGGWDARWLGGGVTDLAALVPARARAGLAAGAGGGIARLVCAGADGRRAWALAVSGGARVRVNGRPVAAGLRVLDDRDEIRVAGVQCFFSTEALAAVEPFPLHDRPVFCGRCRQPIEEGTPSVRCPGPDCQVYYHQDEAGGFPCWTYAAKCNFCPASTALDAGFAWAPEE